MRANFDASLAAVLQHEGGWSNDPHDPGGATNRGVTQGTYDLWRVDHQLPKRSVKHITPAEVMAVYKKRYWDAVRGDEMPSGVDYCLFDFAVNSGHDLYKGFAMGLLAGMAYVMGWWAYWDFQPDPLPEYVSCTVAETGEECPPYRIPEDIRRRHLEG